MHLPILYFFILFGSLVGLEKCRIPLPEDLGPGMDPTMDLIGETDCPYGNSVCNPCVDGLFNQLESINTAKNSSVVHRFRNGDLGFQMNVFKHPQGIARLSGVGNENWMLITRNHFSKEEKAGVMSIEFASVESAGGAWSSGDDGGNDGGNDGRIKSFFTTSDNKHPGGCQVIGHHLVVAHEGAHDSIAEPSWISFYDVSDPSRVSEVNRFVFDGLDALGIPYLMSDKGQAMCVGVTQLYNGHYLMLALESRRRLPMDIGWFFMSTGTDLQSTGWEYIQLWHQNDLLPDSDAFRTYENINLVTDCDDGKMYMLGFYGKGRKNFIDVFSLATTEGDKIVLEKVLEKPVSTRSGGASFRAGGSIHVTPDNHLVIYAVEKSDRGKWLTIEEFGPEEVESSAVEKVTTSANTP